MHLELGLAHEVELGGGRPEDEPVDLLRVLRGEPARDHATGRGRVDVGAFDADRVEELGDLVGPGLDRVLAIRLSL